METKILSGKELAESVLGNVKKKIDTYVSKGKRPPGLAVLLVGDDPASKIYVSKKAGGL